jgi:predicted DNA-binding transcriptional regulator AlpA
MEGHNASRGDIMMSSDHITHPAARPGSSDDPAINGSDGTDQPTAPPRGRLPTDSLIGIREIRQLFGLGRTAAYDLTHRPGFPAPVPVSRNAYRWWASEVAAFAVTLRTESQNSSIGPRHRAQRRTSPQEATHLRITGKVRAARNRRTPR